MVPPALLRWLAVKLGQTGRFALPSLVVSSCAPFDTARTTNQVRQRWRKRRGLNPARVIRSGARKRGRQPLFSGQSGFHGWRVKAVRRSWPQNGTVVTSRVGNGVGINPIAWQRRRIVREYWIPRSQVGGSQDRVVRSAIAVDPKAKPAVGDGTGIEGRLNRLNHRCREALGGAQNGRAVVRDDHRNR